MTDLDRGRRPPVRHPLGRTCLTALPAALVLTVLAICRHPHETWKAVRA